MSDTPHNGNAPSPAPPAKQRGYIRQAWLVILLALIYGAALAGVQTTLGPRIEENKRNETYRVIPKLVFGGAAETAPKHDIVPHAVTGLHGKEQTVYQILGARGQLAGWVLPASGQGFADRIDLLVGLNPAVTAITGIYVLDQKETPGLGDYIRDDEFQDRFVGKSAEAPVEIVKEMPDDASANEGNDVLALSGATISSQSVADIVNKAIERFREPLLALERPQPRGATPAEKEGR